MEVLCIDEMKLHLCIVKCVDSAVNLSCEIKGGTTGENNTLPPLFTTPITPCPRVKNGGQGSPCRNNVDCSGRAMRKSNVAMA